MELSELQKDILLEAFNIGMGRAAATLSQMAHQEVALSIPSIEIVRSREHPGHIPEAVSLAAVSQSFRGDFGQATSLLMFPQDRSYELVRILLGEDVPLETMPELEQDAMKEVGNIILNSLIGYFAEIARQGFQVSLPEFRRDNWARLSGHSLGGAGADESSGPMLLIMIDFSLSESSLQGYLAVFLQTDGLNMLLKDLSSEEPL